MFVESDEQQSWALATLLVEGRNWEGRTGVALDVTFADGHVTAS